MFIKLYASRKDIQMRISVKMVLLVVCVSAGLVFGAAKNAKDVKVEPNDTKAAVKDANMPAKDMKTAVKTEVKEAKPEVKPAAPAVKAAEPNAVAENTGVAVTVNGKDITEADVDAKINAYMDRMASQVPPGMADQYKKQMRPQVVESMVMEQLLDEKIQKANINITDSDVNNKITEIIATQPGMTMETFKSMIASRGQSFDEVKGQIKKTMSYEKLIGNVEVNDAEAKAFYDENKEDFNKPEQVKASHILVKVDASATPEQKAAAKTKIEGLLKQAKAGGDFAALAKENSDDPGSKMNGGDLGFFDRGTMVKEFADAAFALKVGDISGVIETQYGYHIIKVTDRKEGGMMAFDKAKPDIEKSLQDKKKSELFKQLIEKIKAEAKIVYPPGKEPKPRMPMMPKGQKPNGQAPQSESAPMSK
jgi:peptidyl-prolyl cis-trans isomerase C